MKVSEEALNAIKGFEGLKLKSYQDVAGVPTIGYGHTRNVRMGMTITKEQAEMYLIADLDSVERRVGLIKEVDTQGKFDALCDFVFNLGCSKLDKSTLLKKIKENKPISEIQHEFMRWIYAAGVAQKGLINRRAWEAQRYSE